MARIPISDADLPADEFPLASGLGVDLAANLADIAANRLKRHSITYYLGPTDQTGATPPDGDSDLLGPYVEVQGTLANDPEGIGLRLSSPPTCAIAIYLADWPLSANATSVRVLVSCATEVADVDLYAVAVGDTGEVFPYRPSEHLYPDDEGLVSWSSLVTASSAYKRVGTSAPSVTEDSKPVELVIDLTDASGVDLGRHGHPTDSGGRFRLYLCILSREGAASGLGKLTVDNTGALEARRITLSGVPFSSFGNPGPCHMWFQFDTNIAAVDDQQAAVLFPSWRGVVQVRPELPSAAPDLEDAQFVLHPPIDPATTYGETVFQGDAYTCGIVRLHAITIQEFGA